MSTASGVSASAADPSTARSEAEPQSESIRAKRGVELWLDESDTGSPAKPPPPPTESPNVVAAQNAASTSPCCVASAGRRSPQSRPLNGLMASPAVSPGGSARPAAPPQHDDAGVEDQLKLLKEKRKQRENSLGSGASSARDRPESKESFAANNVSQSAGTPDGPRSAPRVPPVPINKSAPTSSGSSRRMAGKPPLSGRRGVQAQTVHTSGRRAAADGPMSSRGEPPALTPPEIVKRIKDLQSTDWKVVSEGLETLRAVLTASSSVQDHVRVIMRQNLHGLVTGTLTAMDSGRSAVSKFATDLLGLVCQKLSTRHLQFDGPDADEEAATAVGGSSNSLEHFIEPIVHKVITKGGAASSRFLYDGASIALRELVPATKPLKVLLALNGISGLKTEKSKVLHAEGLSTVFDNFPANALRGKTDAIGKAIGTADHYVHDANSDVREAGKKLCRSMASYCSESKENLRALVNKTVGAAQPRRAKETLAFCVAVAASDEDLMAKPASRESGAGPETERGAAGPAAADTSASAKEPKSGRRAIAAPSSREATPRQSVERPAPSSATTTPAGSPQEKRVAPRRQSPPPGAADEKKKTRAATKSKTSDTTTPPPMSLDPPALKSPGFSPIRGDEHPAVRNNSFGIDESQLPGRRGDTSPTMAPPPLISPRANAPGSPRMGPMEATQTNNSLFQNASFFTGTISRDMQHEHGEFSASIFAAAEGSSGDRLKALENLTIQLRKRAQDEETSKYPIANATCFALCDVIALRCADTSQKVQVVALSLVPMLFRVVQPAVIDATSPRWISCLSSALASSFPAVHSAAVSALRALMQCTTESNLRNLCQTICMSCSTVRNVNTKVELLEALEVVLKRHYHIMHRDLPDDDDAGPLAPMSPSASATGKLGLTRLDIEFCTETGLRIWCSDPREEVRRVVGKYLLAVVSCGWDGNEAPVLDNKRLDADNWTLIKALIERSRQPVQ